MSPDTQEGYLQLNLKCKVVKEIKKDIERQKFIMHISHKQIQSS